MDLPYYPNFTDGDARAQCVTIAIKRIRDPLSGIIKSKTKDAICIINKAKAEALFAVRSECSLAATNFSLLPVVSSAFCSALSHGFKSLNIFGDEYITDGIKSTASVDYFVELLFSELLSDESKSLFTT